MKQCILLCLCICQLFFACKKTSNSAAPEDRESILSDNTILVTSELAASLISVDSDTLTFNAAGAAVNQIKVGSILVSDISSHTPAGLLRKVVTVSNSAGKKICITEDAALADAIVKGSVMYSKDLSDADILAIDSSGLEIDGREPQGLSFSFSYDQLIYDADGNNLTDDDQIRIAGEIKLEPTFHFELDIDRNKVNKFVAKLTLRNTNKLKAESKVIIASLKKEHVLKSFVLKPFTIIVAGIPVPIAKQWIAIVIGVDGSLGTRIVAGAENVNTAVAGLSYVNGSWSTINTLENNFSFQPLTFQGAARLEPWLQARYEIRPYGIKESRIYLGLRGSVIGEATTIAGGLNKKLKWGVKLSGKAQMQLFDRAILDYEKTFYEREFLIVESSSPAFSTLSTAAVINIAQTTAQSGGLISSDGGSPVTARGVCWSTSSNPTINDNKTNNGTGVGSFLSSISGLTPNTTYYLRAYATNSAGTAYGNSISFMTQQGLGLTVTDIDGNVYNIITIGTQEWFKENLKTTRYRNGDPIVTNLNAAAWESTIQGAYAFPDSNAANNAEFGKLYNWYAVADSRQLCPSGWRVPTDSQWTVLTNYLGGENVAGAALKEAGGAHWSTPNTGTNSSGFSAVGSGEREYRGIYVWFYFNCSFWSSTSWPTSAAFARHLTYYRNSIETSLKDRSSGYSVRCIKN